MGNPNVMGISNTYISGDNINRMMEKILVDYTIWESDRAKFIPKLNGIELTRAEETIITKINEIIEAMNTGDLQL